MTQDRADATVLTLRYADGRGQRFELEPRGDGGWTVVESVLTKGGDWREIGCERADAVALEQPECIAPD